MLQMNKLKMTNGNSWFIVATCFMLKTELTGNLLAAPSGAFQHAFLKPSSRGHFGMEKAWRETQPVLQGATKSCYVQIGVLAGKKNPYLHPSIKPIQYPSLPASVITAGAAPTQLLMLIGNWWGIARRDSVSPQGVPRPSIYGVWGPV